MPISRTSHATLYSKYNVGIALNEDVFIHGALINKAWTPTLRPLLTSEEEQMNIKNLNTYNKEVNATKLVEVNCSRMF